MTEVLGPQLDRLYARWLVGARDEVPVDTLPAAWRDGSTLDASHLLALASQCRQFLGEHVLPADARAAAALPSPRLALVPEAQRLRFRRCVRALSAVTWPALLRLLASRGWQAHPYDWLPEAGDVSLPPLYDEWRAWRRQQVPHETLDATSWDEVTPSERCRLVARLRATDPALAAELLTTRLATLPAEQRLQMLDALVPALSEADLLLLEGLSGDRSEKVRLRASQLRRRLGRREPLEAAVRDELKADFVVGSSGLIRRRAQVGWAALKTQPQRAARLLRLQSVGWNELADVLGLTPLGLANALTLDEPQNDAVLVECAAQTAPVEVVRHVLERLLFGPAGEQPVPFGASLLERLTEAERVALARRGLRESARIASFGSLLAITPAPFGVLPFGELAGSAPWRRLTDTLRALAAEPGAARPGWLAEEIAAIASLLPAGTAGEALAQLTRAGLHPADPALDPLHLNVDLADAPPAQESRS